MCYIGSEEGLLTAQQSGTPRRSSRRQPPPLDVTAAPGAGRWRARRMGGAATAGAVQRSLLRLRHAPARKRGCRRRSRAARLGARAADSPTPRRDGRSRSQPVRARPTPPLAPLRPPLRGAPIRCAPARAPIAKSRRLSAAHASHTSRARRRACGRHVACTCRGHRAENLAHSAAAEAAASAQTTPCKNGDGDYIRVSGLCLLFSSRAQS